MGRGGLPRPLSRTGAQLPQSRARRLRQLRRLRVHATCARRQAIVSSPAITSYCTSRTQTQPELVRRTNATCEYLSEDIFKRTPFSKFLLALMHHHHCITIASASATPIPNLSLLSSLVLTLIVHRLLFHCPEVPLLICLSLLSFVSQYSHTSRQVHLRLCLLDVFVATVRCCALVQANLRLKY